MLQWHCLGKPYLSIHFTNKIILVCNIVLITKKNKSICMANFHRKYVFTKNCDMSILSSRLIICLPENSFAVTIFYTNNAHGFEDICCKCSHVISRYCFQVPDKEVDAVAMELLRELVRFQDRQFHKDPVKVNKTDNKLTFGTALLLEDTVSRHINILNTV